jgi:D-alanine-D-alanine ligase
VKPNGTPDSAARLEPNLNQGAVMHLGTDSTTHSTVLLLEEEESVWSPEAAAEVLAAIQVVRKALERAGYKVVRIPVSSPQALREELKPFDPRECVVFNWYEGVEEAARDAIQVAALLDQLGYAYTGADASALLLTQDKARTKRVLEEHCIPTPPWQLVERGRLKGWERYPAIVKVANEHGSECLTDSSVVHDRHGLRQRVEELGTTYRKLMVSEYIGGREFSVALWGDGRIEALPVVEIDYSLFSPQRPRVRTFDAKWDIHSEPHDEIRVVCQPTLPRALMSRIEGVAHAAYQACRLRDYGRIDIRLSDQEPLVIDVNSNPDIVGDSSFVLAAEGGGYDYPAMLERIVSLAIRRVESWPGRRVP